MQKMTLFVVVYVLFLEVCFVHDGLQAERAHAYTSFFQCVVREYREIPWRALYPRCPGMR